MAEADALESAERVFAGYHDERPRRLMNDSWRKWAAQALSFRSRSTVTTRSDFGITIPLRFSRR